MEGLDLEKVGLELDERMRAYATSLYSHNLQGLMICSSHAGRRPFVEGLDLEKVGVELD